MPFSDILRKHEEIEVDSKKRYEALDWDECQMCGAHGNDKRSFIMRCFYNMVEVVPEMISLRTVDDDVMQADQWFLRICKRCRGELLDKLREWAQVCRERRGDPMDHDGHDMYPDGSDRVYPVRVHGRIKMMTEAEATSYKACHE